MRLIRFISGFVAGAVLAGGIVAAHDEIRVYINGDAIKRTGDYEQ